MTSVCLDAAPGRAVQAYQFPGTGEGVRVAVIDGSVWFAAIDVAAILALGNVHSSLALLDDDERSLHSMETGAGVRQVAVVSEAGLYALILRSRKPEARAFRRWVTHDVIPAIRTTGFYAAPAASAAPALDSPEGVLQLATAYRDAALRLVTAEKRVAELAPIAEAWETLADAEGDYSLRDAAHILNRDPAISTGQNRLMKRLRDEGMVDRRGIPYARYSRYLVERPVSYTHPHSGEAVLTSQVRITPDGLAYLRRRLGGTGKAVA